jgi:hypothetical protein
MIPIFFVGDGRRDAATIPPIVSRILNADLRPMTRAWARLNRGGGGYPKKVQFAARQARDAGAAGLIAVVDRDRDPKREKLRRLQAGRDTDRMKAPPFPTALGEADPHGEAWLLDDPQAIREALGLDQGVEIPTVRKARNPKAALNELIDSSSHSFESPTHALGEIARLVDHSRCVHASETGFGEFVEDVRSELGSTVSPPSGRGAS